MFVESKSAQYEVGQLVARTEAYNVYLCEEVATGSQRLLQIATSLAHSGGLQRAAFLLRKLKDTSDKYETVHAELEPDGKLLSYDRLFPTLVDSFTAEAQGNRQVNIMAFTEVDDITTLVPLTNLTKKDHMRITLTSSAWVMGRLLKLLGLAHGEGIAVRTLSGNNILLQPEQHFAVVFDWSQGLTYPEAVPAQDKDDKPVPRVPSSVRKDDIASAAFAVLTAIGADASKGTFAYADDDTSRRYVECLWRLACRRENDAEGAHDQFYELVDQLWGREFRPFQTLPL
jgi:hypothetical protein